MNKVNTVNSINSVNSVKSVNSVNSYSAVLPPSPMVFSVSAVFLTKQKTQQGDLLQEMPQSTGSWGEEGFQHGLKCCALWLEYSKLERAGSQQPMPSEETCYGAENSEDFNTA